MKKIIYTRPDGGLSVVHPIINTHPELEKITEDQAVQRAFAKLPKEAINPQIVDESVIPTDRTFRNAWKASGSSVVQDMDKCRAIYRDSIRETREPLFKKYDCEWMRAVAAGNAVAAAAAENKRQALRDAPSTPAIAIAATPAELKAIVPAVFVAEGVEVM